MARKITDEERCLLGCVGILLLGLESVRVETRAAAYESGTENRGHLQSEAELAAKQASLDFTILCQKMGSEG